MRRLAAALALVAALSGPGSALAATAPVTVRNDRTQQSLDLGRSFTFRTTVANPGSAATEKLVAHLNVLSLAPGVYVDPEDWSSNRTRYLSSIPAGGSRMLSWRVKAVNGGTFAAYVVVVPQRPGTAAPATGQVLRFDVAERRTLDAGGVLPLALGIPLALAALWLLVRVGRRRRSSRTAVSEST